MATRSYIARKTNNYYEGVYCHWDGYPEYNGAILFHDYSDSEKLAQLLSYGDISVLGSVIGSKHDFDSRDCDDVTTYYGRDRGETGIVAEPKTFDSLDQLKRCAEQCGAEFLYIFDGYQWLYAERSWQFFGMSDGTPLSALRPLSERLAQAVASR